MNCEEFHGLISGRIDGENTEEENRRLDAHLEACEDCRELLAALTQTQADIFALREAPPADLTQRIMQTVQSAPRKRQRNARKSFFFGSAATALVACAVFALIALGKIPLPHLADKKDAAVAEAAPQSAALGSGDSVMKYAQLNDSLLYGCAVAPGSNSGASLPAPFESDRLYGTEESTEFAPNESESSGEPTESFVSRGLITPAVNAPLMVFWNADPANLSLLDNLAPVGGESEKSFADSDLQVYARRKEANLLDRFLSAVLRSEGQKESGIWRFLDKTPRLLIDPALHITEYEVTFETLNEIFAEYAGVYEIAVYYPTGTFSGDDTVCTILLVRSAGGEMPTDAE